MVSAQDVYHLEDIGSEHLIDASVFVPFAIVRLRGHVDSSEAALRVELRDLFDFDDQVRTVRIIWSGDSIPTDPLAVPDRAITEWAACGVACMLVPAYTPLRILSVAAYGDRFDYWLNDGQKDYGLEISGTVAGELEPRHRVKVNQLLANPYGIDGYVAVVAFETKTAIFSFHPSQEPAE
jgi:hypothetical protein